MQVRKTRPRHIYYGNPAFFLNLSYMVNNIFFAAKNAIDRNVLKGQYSDNEVSFFYRNRLYTIQVSNAKLISMFYSKMGNNIFVTYHDDNIYQTIYESLKTR